MRPIDLKGQYRRRFSGNAAHRDRVWQTILDERLQQWVGEGKDVLDLGCGWGEFIRNVRARSKNAMDLNPDAGQRLGDDITFLHQDCSDEWPLEDASLDVVFTSNFIEHLRDKTAVESTLRHLRRCLRDDGRAIFLGPNVKYIPGAYWDFWDHHVPISHVSLQEVLELSGFRVVTSIPRFLPYTMSGRREAPIALVRLYLRLPLLWPLFGRQFLVIAEPDTATPAQRPSIEL